MPVAYLKNLVEPLVEYPDEIRIEESRSDLGVLLSLTLSQEDTGMIIGREGNTVRSIRKVLEVYGRRHKMRLSLKIVDPLPI